MPDGLSILAGALALDLLVGEPPAAIHPVVWMGRLQSALRRWAPSRPAPAFLWGAVMALAGPVISGGAALAVLGHTSGLVRWLIAVYLLKSALSARELAAAAWRVGRRLGAGDVDGARRGLRNLVSRDPAGLTPSLIAAAAIESVAENASDSIAAPILFYAVGGVPAAIAYRAINTLDAMVGYRGELEWLGKAAARLDDAANVVPARATALLLALSAPLGRGSVRRALGTWTRDRGLTESPNAGHPMAAMAGALGVALEKRGAYCLGAELREPDAADVGRAVRVMAGAAALATAVAALALARGA